MKKCPVCGAQNFDTSTSCDKCKHPFDRFFDPAVSTMQKQSQFQQQSYIPPQQEYYTYTPPQYSSAPSRQYDAPLYSRPAQKNKGLRKAAQIFLIINCVLVVLLCFLTLIFTIASEATGYLFIFFAYFIEIVLYILVITHHYNRMSEDAYVGLGFKICTLLFFNFISGILMLCDSD